MGTKCFVHVTDIETHRDLVAPRPSDIFFVLISVTGNQHLVLYPKKIALYFHIVIFCSSCERYRNSKPVPISIIHTNIGTSSYITGTPKNNYNIYGIKCFDPVTDIGTQKMAYIGYNIGHFFIPISVTDPIYPI